MNAPDWNTECDAWDYIVYTWNGWTIRRWQIDGTTAFAELWNSDGHVEEGDGDGDVTRLAQLAAELDES